MSLAFSAVAHVNVNCASLARSLPFYRDVLGFTPLAHTHPRPQDGAAFGLSGLVEWDAHILHDDRSAAGPAIDLLEWKIPAPCGALAPANGLGFSRLLLHSARPGEILRDPDGVLLELRTADEAPERPRFAGVALNVSRLERSLAWYAQLLALPPAAIVERESSGVALGLGPRVRWREAALALTPVFSLRLVEWRDPVATQPAPAAANALGLYRLALLVDDATQACAQLDALGLRHSGAAWLDMGPEIPIDGLHAGFLPDPDGACVEWIERPRLRR
jgi:catechol 2,3-dioxygenase-like lactoylglutathione lyase family enzyme